MSEIKRAAWLPVNDQDRVGSVAVVEVQPVLDALKRIYEDGVGLSQLIDQLEKAAHP